MILAAGLGTRMQPLTHDLPKPLISVRGRPLIDYALERLSEAGIGTVVVNAHHHADQLTAHLTRGTQATGRVTGQVVPAIQISDERAALLDTGGGLAKALPMLGEAPFYTINSDVIWLDSVGNTLHRLAQRWEGDEMDALLLVNPCTRAIGYAGVGDFMMDGEGLVRRRQEREVAPYVYTGVQILHPRLFEDCPQGPFSLNVLYDRAIDARRLYGLSHDGLWLHVGTLDGLHAAERALAAL
ncbi:MAG: nucleotidyltransferase family protein [Proteobacteria bacterium]|nr:nucleotidyltransferase family protein [Pseudomonadota bacterium]